MPLGLKGKIGVRKALQSMWLDQNIIFATVKSTDFAKGKKGDQWGESDFTIFIFQN